MSFITQAFTPVRVSECTLPNPIVATLFNLDGEHSLMEMLLSSLYDGSYVQHERTLIAENGLLEYRYSKGPVGNRMLVRLLSLRQPDSRFRVRFDGNSFPVRLIRHPLLDLSALISRQLISSTER